MKANSILIAAVLSFALGLPNLAQADYAKGMEAYELGDYATALSEFLISANQGDANSQYKLGFMYSGGEGVEVDFEKSMHWYLLAADQGQTRAMHNIGVLFYSGFGVETDFDEAERWFRGAANAGQVESMVALAQLIQGGFWGMPLLKDQTTAAEAVDWYIKAAETGDPDAMNRLAILYSVGMEDFIIFGEDSFTPGAELLAPNDQKSLDWRLKAAEAGQVNAQSVIAFWYRRGVGGLEQNYDKMLELYLLAADQGSAYDMAQIGDLYFAGEGVEQNYETAMAWYLKSTQNPGNHNASYKIGKMYQEGLGVEKDTNQAIRWFKAATHEMGGIDPSYQLGLMYLHGTGGADQDNAKAYKWLRVASRWVVDDQQKIKDEMYSLVNVMTNEQIAEGLRLYGEWKAINDEKYGLNRLGSNPGKEE